VGTAFRVFEREPALVVLAIDAEAVSKFLRWEAASNGEPFPHVYAPLPLSAVVAVHKAAGAASVEEVLLPE
jgi:uncharacterized protein (DUF952 family)